MVLGPDPVDGGASPRRRWNHTPRKQARGIYVNSHTHNTTTTTTTTTNNNNNNTKSD